MIDLYALWDFQRADVSEARFRAALAAAQGEDVMVLRTQLARALGLQRRFDEGAAELDALGPEDELTPLVRTHLRLERGRLLNSSGQRDASIPHFLRGLETAEAAGLDVLAADAAHMLAIVETGEAQIPWARRALAIAEASTDPRARRWAESVTHNLGWTLHDLGRHEEALGEFQRALELRQRQGDPERIRVGRWTVARELRGLGRLDEALAMQRELDTAGTEDGYVSEELGELLLGLGRPAEARPYFARASELLSRDAWLVSLEPERVRRLARLGSAGVPAE
ncbi:MAG: tetratricopeptide repeat protein [Chloroflexi bacterium]|nr:MAG: tetratricopeptide repeat protein [Chloroflexota bacterium]